MRGFRTASCPLYLIQIPCERHLDVPPAELPAMLFSSQNGGLSIKERTDDKIRSPAKTHRNILAYRIPHDEHVLFICHMAFPLDALRIRKITRGR